MQCEMCKLQCVVYTVQCIVYLLQITLQRSVVGSVVSSVQLSVYSMTFLLRVVRGQAVRVVQVI